MPYARPYNRLFSFLNFQRDNPSRPVPAEKVDAELNEVKLALDQTQSNLKRLQRSDGALGVGVVTQESLAPGLSIGFTFRGIWREGQGYFAGDGVSLGAKMYRARRASQSATGNSPEADTESWEELVDLDAVVRAATGEELLAAGEPIRQAIDLKAGLSALYTVAGRSPTFFGALGNGVANDTAAFQTAVNLGGSIRVPAGRYLVDEIVATRPIFMVLEPGAEIAMRTADPTSLAVRPTGTNILRLTSGAKGSIISGGVFDGRRDVLGAAYPNYPRGDARYCVWEGIRADFCDDITIVDVSFKGFVNSPFRIAGGDRPRIHVRVANCGQSGVVQGVSSLTIPYSTGADIRVDARDIGNSYPATNGTQVHNAIFQHASEVRFLRNATVVWSVTNFYGDSFGLEPVPICFGFDSCDNSTFDLKCDGYSGNIAHIGAIFNSKRNCDFRLISSGYEQGLQIISGLDSNIHIQHDGRYQNRAGYPREGVITTPGGVFPISPAGLAGETSSNLVAQNIRITGHSIRSGIGVRIQGGGCTFDAFRALGNETDGIQIAKSAEPSISFPGGAGIKRKVSRTRLIGCTSRGNGQNGLVGTSGDVVEVLGGDFANNGQFQVAGMRNGINLLAEAGEIREWTISDVNLDDTGPLVNDVGGLTYEPGVTTANLYRFDVLNPNQLDLGQFVYLRRCLAGGGDAYGRIVDRLADVITVQFAGPQTFAVPASNLTLLGTGYTSGNGLVIPGGGLINGANKVLFRVYLQHPINGEYRRIVYVDSDTHAVLDTPFSTPIPAGSPIRVVKADIAGPGLSQVSALRIGGSTVGPLTVKGMRHAAIKNDLSSGNLACIAPGSEIIATYSTFLNTSSDISTLVTGIPAGFQVVKATLTITAQIIGPDGTGSVVIVDNNSPVFTAANVPNIANGSVGNQYTGWCPEAPAFKTALGAVWLVFAGGASNTPSAGAVSVDLTLRRI